MRCGAACRPRASRPGPAGVGIGCGGVLATATTTTTATATATTAACAAFASRSRLSPAATSGAAADRRYRRPACVTDGSGNGMRFERRIERFGGDYRLLPLAWRPVPRAAAAAAVAAGLRRRFVVLRLRLLLLPRLVLLLLLLLAARCAACPAAQPASAAAACCWRLRAGCGAARHGARCRGRCCLPPRPSRPSRRCALRSLRSLRPRLVLRTRRRCDASGAARLRHGRNRRMRSDQADRRRRCSAATGSQRGRPACSSRGSRIGAGCAGLTLVTAAATGTLRWALVSAMRRQLARRAALVAGLAGFLAELVLADAGDFVMRRLQLVVGDDHDRRVVALSRSRPARGASR